MLGFVSLRVGGIAFAMVTLAFAQAGAVLVHKDPHHWTHGEEGLGADYHKLPSAFVGIFNTKNLYWLALAYVGVVFLVTRWAVESSPGRVWQAIRENELRVEVLGLRPRAYKLKAFVLASFLATLGGIVYMLLNNGSDPSIISPNFTLMLLLMVVIGGAGSRWGAVLGGVLYHYLDNRLGAVGSSSTVQGPAARAAHAARAAALPARHDLHPDRLLPAREALRASPRAGGRAVCAGSRRRSARAAPSAARRRRR